MVCPPRLRPSTYLSPTGLTACGPIPGNKNGSYLTMYSSGGIIFAIINVVGNFGTVFLDQAYWQSAIAARPTAAVKVRPYQ